MNENTFSSQRTHTRVKFNPLQTSCQLVCLTPMSPASQTVNALGQSPIYEPDRTITPTVILPDCRANDPDNIFTHGPCNQYLAIETIEWFVNSEPIEDVWTASTDYDINTTATDLRGALTVKKNIPASDKAVLTFKGRFLDWRTGISYSVQSDELVLSTTDKGSDSISCSVDKPLINYDALFDDLLLYDYKVARNIPVQGNRSDYVNGKCYEQEINVIFVLGTEQQLSLPTGYTMRVTSIGGSTAFVPNSAEHPELLSATYPTVKFDMRLISKAEYEIQFVKDNKVVANATVGLNTQTTMPFSAKPLRGADLTPAMQTFVNTVLINLEDRVVEYPECFYLIQWITQAKSNNNGTWQYAAEKTWQNGENIQAAIKDLGIGVTYNDSFFDLWFDIDPHDTMQLAADESDELLLADDGDYFLI